MQILHIGINGFLQHYKQGMDQTGRLSMWICILISTKISRNCEKDKYNN